MFESLEARRLLSAAIKAGVLNVRGTAGPDDILISQQGKSIIVQLSTKFSHATSKSSFLLKRVQSINVNALGGNDRIDARGVDIANTLAGGIGDDILLGSASSNLLGGAGKNKLRKPKGSLFIWQPPNTGTGLIDIGGIGGIGGGYQGSGYDIGGTVCFAGWPIVADTFVDLADCTTNPPIVPSEASAVLTAPSITITGTNNSDSIVLEQQAETMLVHVNGHDFSFSLNDFSHVVIRANDGDDLVDASGTSLDAYILGGNGNDTLIGGSAGDSINGEGGTDQLHGGAGNDNINGGADSDTMWGDDGDDVLDSIDGLDDTLYGGDGFDSNNTYADTAESIENRPLPPQPVCACMEFTVVGGGSIYDGITQVIRPEYIPINSPYTFDGHFIPIDRGLMLASPDSPTLIGPATQEPAADPLITEVPLDSAPLP